MKKLLLTLAVICGVQAPLLAKADVVQPINGTGFACNKSLPVSITASTDLHTMVKYGYICSVLLMVTTGENVSLVEGTGSVCGTGTVAIIGGTTAAAGLPLTDHEGFSMPSNSPLFTMTTIGDHLCLLKSSSSLLSGTITYIDR